MRYDECSNGQLTFIPATGTGVNDGVITVSTTTNLSTQDWRQCGNIGLNLVTGVSANYRMIVCPDVVDFEGAAAWGQMPGYISWYLSSYASVPIVQVHEVVSKASRTAYHHWRVMLNAVIALSLPPETILFIIFLTQPVLNHFLFFLLLSTYCTFDTGTQPWSPPFRRRWDHLRGSYMQHGKSGNLVWYGECLLLQCGQDVGKQLVFELSYHSEPFIRVWWGACGDWCGQARKHPARPGRRHEDWSCNWSIRHVQRQIRCEQRCAGLW